MTKGEQMRRVIRTLTSLAVLTTLAGCSCKEQDCDPTGGGLFGAICCSASGSYDKRIAARETKQAALMQRKTQLEQEAQRLQAEQAVTADDLAAKQAEHARAERELAAVRKKLTGSQAENRALKDQATALEREVAKSKNDITDLTQAETRRAARIAELEAEQAKLQKEYEAASGR
jgi:chromosome segregation ATPase